jgi:hypothetical protein
MFCFPYGLGRRAELLHINFNPSASSSSLGLRHPWSSPHVPAKGTALKASLTLFRQLLARRKLAP